MKLSKYINKYNYIDYYTKPKGLWFFSIQEIEQKLAADIEFYKAKLKDKNVDYADDLAEETSEDELEKDSYEYYKELKEKGELKKDNANIYIIQGNIIDKELHNYVCQKYNNIKKIYNLENEFKFKNNEQWAEKTKQLLQVNEQIIIFQPVFIYQNLITKPDALIKMQNTIKIIETKGTTSAKFVHYLDLFFQMNVIEKQNYLKEMNCLFDYELCLIEYKYLNKNEVSLETTPYINLSKVVSIPDLSKKNITSKNEIIKCKNAIKKGEPIQENVEPLKIKDLMYDRFNTILTNIECTKPPTKTKFANAYELIKKINNNFLKIIQELDTYKKTLKKTSYPVFKPSVNDKSKIKNCEYFMDERKLYALMGYNLFNYSGNVADQSQEKIKHVKKRDKINNFLKQPKNNPSFYLDLFSIKNKGLIEKIGSSELINELYDNKVYFDFETINSPIRVIDNSLPFMQIVTQCSIIKATKKTKLAGLNCNNLIIDPKKVDLAWFEKIIDELYFGPKPIWKDNQFTITKPHKTSYIVYNKSFECTRLKEMADFLKKPLYTFKVNQIIKNIYDLADFFKLSANFKKSGYLIFLKELFGFYSIKKVLPLVGKYYPDIYKITNCKDYNQLAIGNGQICQEEAIKRFFNLIDNQKWKHLEKEMQIYCENDVRSMIAIELFIKELLKNYNNVID